MSFGARLRDQRKELGLTQEALAHAVGASKRAVIDWEKDVAAPNATYLAAMAAAGVDVQYLLISIPVRDRFLRDAWKLIATEFVGGRDEEDDELKSIVDYYNHQAEALGETERELIKCYRLLGASAQTALLDMARNMRNLAVHGGPAATPAQTHQQNFHAPVTNAMSGDNMKNYIRSAPAPTSRRPVRKPTK